VLIGVRGQGESGTVGGLAEDPEVAGGGLFLIKVGADDRAGRIVNPGVQHKCRAAVFQPGVMTAIELGEHALLRHAVAAGPVGWRAPGPGTTYPGGSEDAVDRRAREEELFVRGEQLGEVLEVDAGVLGPSEMQEAVPRRGRGAPGGRTAAVAVDQGGRPAHLVGGPQATHLAGREAQDPGRLSHGAPALLEGVEDKQAVLLSWCQGNRSHKDRGFAQDRERTFSLNA